MLAAIKKEIGLRSHELQNKELKSLYFGGGTPSVLEVDEVKILIDEVLKYFTFAPDIEITLEANPDDLNSAFLKELRASEINRLSIGTQSFFDDDLVLMNRAHSAAEAESSIKRAQDSGFENLSIDLIYGSPTSDFSLWKESLNKAVALEVPHISAYALTVEPKTALNQWIAQNKIQPPKESEQTEDFYYMSDFLKLNGFQHYEISNFAKPGLESRHNTAYWQYREYLGLGPSAHSYDGRSERSWNVANNQKYINALNQNILAKETEFLSEKDRFNEMLMIGLRTAKGVDLSVLNQSFSAEIQNHLDKETSGKLQRGTLVIENGFLKIPEVHWFLADGIAADLFYLGGD
jgi:oxygen-independent coproporphyrinogen-3 oxidase